MKFFLVFILSLVVNTVSGQVTNTKSGLWSDASSWSNNMVPTDTTNIILSYDIVVDINSYCQSLYTNRHSVKIISGVTLNQRSYNYNQKGTLYGTVKLINKDETQNLDFMDLKINLIDPLNIPRQINLNSDGSFLVDSVPYGISFLKVERPGFGLAETLSFYVHKSIDTLSTIKLAEVLPFSYNSFSIYYGNNSIHYSRSTNYESTDSYLVGELICFGKNSKVSLNNCDFFTGTGSFSNVSTINWKTNSSTSCSLQNFTNSGSKIGDTIYSVCYPIIHSNFTLYNEQGFYIMSYKIGDPSPVSSFVLKQ